MCTLADVKTINIEELQQLLEHNPNVVLFDMRLEQEYDAAHIPEAIHLTQENFNEEAKYFNDKTVIILQCYRGNASKALALDLMRQGVKEVYSLDGGITAWAKAGCELVTS
ncbi:rhodanese-like domain-containing protein [Psittacicella gerlachiana]|uniref:Rhodanese domain-containing protein n=1 Tax=Psittacicella gerlachiana TaxID=2028574 RepID=A0A3A1Y4E3_9GAMM|nr:rhodanese-like domain-containing protein [Psittacicella gerlachiana]RIY32088.1 hypothetical protein CKF59_07210 [Psittacicella gerlachiana]